MSYRPSVYAGPTSEIVYFVRPAGNDGNNGLTAGAAFATFDRALAALRRDQFGRSQIIDITGMTISEANQKVIPSPATGINWDLDPGASTPGNFIYRTKLQIRATPALDTAITIDSIAADAVTGLMTLTVLEALVPNAHIGQFVLGDSPTEWGVIVTNTVNDIFVAAQPGLIPTGAAGIYDVGAQMTFGDAANSFQQALYILPMSDLTIQGIGFSSTASSKAVALDIFPRFPVNLTLCAFEGIGVEQGGGTVRFDACYIYDKSWAHNDSETSVRSCFFSNVTMNTHAGPGGFNGCVWDDCEPVIGGNFETRASVSVGNSEIRNAKSIGVLARTPNNLLRDLRIDDSAGDAVLCDRNTWLYMSNVVGTGNGGFGVSILNGSQINDNGVNTVTGASGGIELGTGNVVAWAAGVPAVGADFSRIYQ